jgi:imidazolonepropionase-like amidohydrolase
VLRCSSFCAISAVSLLHLRSKTKIQPIVFTHVTVIDTARALAQADQTVLVAGDRITDVYKTGTVNVPADAQVVDATGRFLIPGLWDMHVHTFKHNRSPPTNGSFPCWSPMA